MWLRALLAMRGGRPAPLAASALEARLGGRSHWAPLGPGTLTATHFASIRFGSSTQAYV